MKITPSRINTLLTIGGNLNIEFKRAGDGPKADTFESVCAFLNKAGGDLLLGVDDDGTVVGLPPKSVDAMIRNGRITPKNLEPEPKNLCDENRGNAIYPARGIPMFLNVALSLFEKMGIRRIAMNGIRVYWSDGVKDHGHLAEAFLFDSALQWLDTYEHHFESMDFVDLRGGFGKAHLENPDEPSVVDPKAMPSSSKDGWFSTQNLPIDIEGAS